MKKILLFILALLPLMPSCAEDEIKTYDARDFIYFSSRTYISSVVYDTLQTFNFFFAPGVEDTTLNLKVSCGGIVPDRDREFQVEVEVISGTEGSEFEIGRTHIMPANASQANIPIRLHSTDALEGNMFEIKVTLLPNENFTLAMPEVYQNQDTIQRTTMAVQFMNKLEIPAYWDTYETYIGYFSEAKFNKFNELYGFTIDDWIDSTSKLRKYLLDTYIIAFVNYLNAEIAKGPEYAIKDPDAQSMRGYMYVPGYEYYGVVLVPPVVVPEEFPTTPEWEGTEEE